MRHTHFPLYLDIRDKKILVVGAGEIALRRITTLLKFQTDITVVAREIRPEIHALGNQVRLIQKAYGTEDLQGKDIVLACTDSAAVNREIAKACKERGILVNAADKKELCDFYFPSVVEEGELVIAINAGGKNHGLVKKARECLEEINAKPDARKTRRRHKHG